MRNLLLFFLVLFIGKIYGQDNFKRGYIITNEKDSVSGWIDFRTDAQNMRACKFKTDETEKVITYLPGEIISYRFYQEGKLYVSREITINDQSRVVFLEYLLQGIMNLYYYIDTSISGLNITYYFFEDETGKMTPVTKKPDGFIQDDQGDIRNHEDFRYIGTMRYLFKDQESISKKVDKLKFNQKSMISVAKEYHDLVCTTGEECIVFETKEDKKYNLFKFSVYGGVQLYYEKSFDAVTSPVIGGRLNVSVPRLDKNLSFQADIAISKIQGHGTSAFSGWEVNSVFVPLQLGAKYSFGKYKIRPTIDGGLSYLSSFGKNYKFYIPGQKFPIYQELSSYQMDFGLFGSLGLEYILNNKYSMFINAGGTTSQSINLLQFKLGFTF